MKKEYLTINEAAEFLNKSVRTIYILVGKRKIPHLKRGQLYFKIDELKAWLEDGKREVID